MLSRPARRLSNTIYRRKTSHLHTRIRTMALQVQLKAPNGVEFTLPTGLFINNEFVKSTSSQRITSISPR